MDAIASVESGGNPNAVNKGSGAHGTYQIMPSNWGPWAVEAGLGRNAEKSAENQRRVAQHKMQQYYDRFKSWDAVAIAWFAGPGRAARWLQGDKSVLSLSDGGATVAQYVSKVRQRMAGSSFGGGAAERMAANQSGVTREVTRQHLGIPKDYNAQNNPFSRRLQVGQDARMSSEEVLAKAFSKIASKNFTRQSAVDQVNEVLKGLYGDKGYTLDEGTDPSAPNGKLLPNPVMDLGDITPGRNGIPAGLKPNAARGAAIARRVFEFTGVIGGLGHRSNKSDHPHGNAIDIMTMGNVEFGQQIADYFRQHAQVLGVKYVIFNKRIASAKNGWAWRPYSHPSGGSNPTLDHVDHPHISFY